MKKQLVFLFATFGLAALAPRCSSDPQDCTQTSTCPQEASDGPGPLNCDTTTDPKDAPSCLDDRVGIFVSPTGSDTNAGTKEAPVQTITHALSLTATLKRIYVCEGTYAEDVVYSAAADGVSIYGGFGCADWGYTGNKPTIGKGNIALTIAGTTKPIAIEDLVVKSADGIAGTPSSIAALVANASGMVTFARVNLTAGKGATATDAAAGANYNASLTSSDPSIKGHDATGASGGTLQLCASLCTDTITSTGGSGGQGTTSPGQGSNGTPSLGAGVGGTPNGTCSGGNGASSTTVGPDAASPAALGALTETGWAASAGASGKNGTPGQGGGGGAGQSQTNDGGGGGGACGGCGGGGGGGGVGGGASIALATVASSVTVTASELHAGDAGNAGKGAIGQAGQTGGAHGNGSGFGCSGGNGGTGSAGGTGAGGVGGISVGVLYKGSQPTVDAASTGAITVGKAGSKGVGGTAGANDGIDGVAQPVLPAP